MSAANDAPVVAYSFGYWGWGNATPEFVRAVDAVEASRASVPPLFVDVRFSRGVRAVGFRERAFADLLGPERYRWMRGLGNAQIGASSGPRMRIADPEAATELLDLVRAAAAVRRHVLFFCSCEHPVDDAGVACHRVEVARLLRKVAASRGHALTTVEWPGGHAGTLSLEVPAGMLRAVARARATLVVPEPVDLAVIGGLPWGSLVRARAGEVQLVFASGPARRQGGAWVLPVLQRFAARDGAAAEQAEWAAEFRRRRGYEPAGPAPTATSAPAPC